MIERQKRIKRSDLQARPDTLFLFGDNWCKTGFGGQAKEMRGEPNAVGILTKRAPRRDSSAYLTDADFSWVRPVLDEQFLRVLHHIQGGGVVVVPEDGLGTGLAELPTRAPLIHRYIEDWVRCLSLEGLVNGQV